MIRSIVAAAIATAFMMPAAGFAGSPQSTAQSTSMVLKGSGILQVGTIQMPTNTAPPSKPIPLHQPAAPTVPPSYGTIQKQ